MAFLTKEEMKSVIRANHLDAIADADSTIIDMGIAAGTTDIKSRLTPGDKKEWMDGRPHYDVEAIFGATGTSRNALILEITKVAALWWIIVRCNAGVIYEHIKDRYDRSIDYVKELSTGEANDLTLPRLTPEEEEEADPDAKPFRMGSRPKFYHE